jgi:hypothetical protein
MFIISLSLPRSLQLLVVASVVVILPGCGPAANQSAVPTKPYDRAKDAFRAGQLDKALDLTAKLATANPSVDSTDRARVLRAVIYAGELKGTKEMAETYGKGAEKAKNPRFQSEYRRLQHDDQQMAAAATLNLAETAHQIAPGGVIAKEITLDASYPATEGPPEVKELARVEDGSWIEPDQQETAAADSLRKGVDDALADAVGGDRAKARQMLGSGPVNLDGAAFAIFMAKEIADGAVMFDRHHIRDPQKLITVCDEGDEILKAALASLKETPNKDEAAEVKKLQDAVRTIRKDK